MILFRELKPVKKWWFAWYPVFLQDTQETVWLQKVWIVKVPSGIGRWYRDRNYYLRSVRGGQYDS